MNLYKGVIVENSLNDRKILDEVRIVKKYKDENWVLYEIEIMEDNIKDLQKYINDGPWYIHLWRENNDKVYVVFKDNIFKIKYSDKSTWGKAIDYGKKMGIP